MIGMYLREQDLQIDKTVWIQKVTFSNIQRRTLDSLEAKDMIIDNSTEWKIASELMNNMHSSILHL